MCYCYLSFGVLTLKNAMFVVCIIAKLGFSSVQYTWGLWR